MHWGAIYRVGFAVTFAALSNGVAAAWPSRADYEHVWNIITPLPSPQYRIEIPEDMIGDFVSGVEVLDSTDAAMRYVTYGQDVPMINSASLPLTCSSPSDNATGSTIQCSSSKEAIEVSTIDVGVRTNGIAPSVKLTLRDGDRVVADFEQDVRIYTVLNPPVHKAGTASRQLHLDPPQLLRSLSIDVNVPAVEAANMTLFAKPSMQKVYVGIEKWRQAPLVSADIGTHTFTFANPFERPLISIGRLTFLSPIDSVIALSSFGCQASDCSGPTEKYAARSLPRSPVHGLSDSAPTTLIPLDAKHYYRVVLQSDAASAPTLDVGYSDAGLVFTADGKPPYVLVASPKQPQRARIGYGGDRFEARAQPTAVTATLSGYSVVDRTRFFGFTQIGPIVFFIMLLIGLDWALDWRIGRRLTREWPRGSRAD
jgi:hypothetical protein